MDESWRGSNGSNSYARQRRQLVRAEDEDSVGHGDGRVCTASEEVWYWIEAVAGVVRVGICDREHGDDRG